MAETRVRTLPVLPLTTGVVGPQMVVTLALETPEARAAADDASRGDGRILLVPRLEGGRYARVGTVAKIEQDGGLPGGQRALVVRGLERAVIGAGRTDMGDALWVETEPVALGVVSSPEIDRLVSEYRVTIEAILEHRGARQLAEAITTMHDPHAVADLALYSPDLSFEQKVVVLETLDVEARLRQVLAWAKETLADLSVRDEVRRNLEEEIGKEQREAVLRRQMAAIQKELGEAGDGEGLAEGYRARLAGLVERGVAASVTEAIGKELDKLARTSPQSPEHGWIVAWLDTVFEVPWGVEAAEALDLDEARRVLDEDHAGLERVKERVLEYLAVRKLRAERGVDAREKAEREERPETVTPYRRGAGTLLALVGSSRRGQDLAGGVHRPGPGPPVRPGGAGWRP